MFSVSNVTLHMAVTGESWGILIVVVTVYFCCLIPLLMLCTSFFNIRKIFPQFLFV